MTDERAAIEALAKCRFSPGSFAKRFARDLAAMPEDTLFSPKQRQCLWQHAVKYRRQLHKVHVEKAKAWLAVPDDRRYFENQLSSIPSDGDLRLIYADWLGERGDPLEEAQRWMARMECWPRLDPLRRADSMASVRQDAGDFEWTFGTDLFVKYGTVKSSGTVCYWYSSREGAEFALSLALRNGHVCR